MAIVFDGAKEAQGSHTMVKIYYLACRDRKAQRYKRANTNMGRNKIAMLLQNTAADLEVLRILQYRLEDRLS